MLMFSEACATITDKLGVIANALKPIAKDADNPHFGSKYADYPALMAALQPLLDDARCYLTHHYAPGVHITDGHWLDEPVMFTRLTCMESQEWVESFVPYAVQDVTNPQRHGSAMTYAKRYGLSNLFNIVTGTDDDDGNAASSGGASNRQYRGTGSGTDEHGVRKIKSKFGGPCAMCDNLVNEGDDVAWKKGKPAVHWSCYEAWKNDTAHDAPQPDAEPLPTRSDEYDDDLPFA